MTTTVRVSPQGVFVCVCVGFVVLYALKSVMFATELQLVVSNEVPMRGLIEVSIYLAEKGGTLLKDILEKNDLKETSKGPPLEGAKDVLTAGDMESHKAIIHGFHNLFPLVTVVSEEHDRNDEKNQPVQINMSEIMSVGQDLLSEEYETVSTDDLLIWIDPLDATKEYTEKLVQYVTTMVCIVVKGVPVAGVIHQPFLKRTAWAWVGHGHSKGLTKPEIHEASLTSPRIIVSRSHAGPVNVTAKLAFGKDVTIIPAGGAGYKVLSLFSDIADAYVHKTLIKKWDICAGDALLRSFGGKMTTLRGSELIYGDPLDMKNPDGLLASLSNHAHYLDKLSALR